MLLDKALALIAILFLAPILVITAMGILVSDFGPILYKAKRAGKNLKTIDVLKFRSMKIQTENISKITSKNDYRVFPFGKIIRLLKIDELPQLFNILKGEMNIIGPRPEDIDIVQKYYDELMLESLSVNPGLSSPGSLYYYTHVEDTLDGLNVEQKYIDDIMPLKVKIDVIYVQNKNFCYDVAIMFKTIAVIFQRAIGKNDFRLPKEYYLAKKL